MTRPNPVDSHGSLRAACRLADSLRAGPSDSDVLAQGRGRRNSRISPRTSAADPAPFSRFTRERARSSIAARPIDTDNVRAGARGGNVMRPVPQPSSRSGPFWAAARLRQNGTSRRPTVRAFSQS